MHTPTSTGTRTPSRCRTPKIERVRNALIELLPSQEDADLICSSSNSWLIVHALSTQTASVFVTNEESIVNATFNMAEVSKKHPTSIARTLMYLAVCLQQLDPTFDTSRLHLYPSVESRIEKYIATVTALIISDDELVTSMEGLECLSLQGIYYINSGSPRRAWLKFRRSLSVGQIMGIHRSAVAKTLRSGRELWFQMVQGDRYLSLLLGLPAGSNDDKFETHENFQNPEINKDSLFNRKLSVLSSRIIDRNQSEHSSAYAATQDIDEQLDALAKEMPQSWWDIPTDLGDKPAALRHASKADGTANSFDRLMAQIWFFQLQGLLHLPFMLRAATERRYEYSRFSCLKASREMMWRYLSMRSLGDSFFCCKVVDFGALTASVSLFLGVLNSDPEFQTRDVIQQQESDRALIYTVLQSIEKLVVASNGKDVIASQSVNVIKTLLAVDTQAEKTGNLRLTIPYFGTISIVRTQQKQNPGSAMLPGQQSITLGQEESQWQGTQYPNPNPMNVPTVTFTSSQFPPIAAEQPPIVDYTWQESDTLFFDSLLNADIDGNWSF